MAATKFRNRYADPQITARPSCTQGGCYLPPAGDLELCVRHADEARREQWRNPLSPWPAHPAHRLQLDGIMLQLQAREEAGEFLTTPERTRLKAWRHLLHWHGVVIDYSPTRGFHRIQARPGETLIRQPEPCPHSSRGGCRLCGGAA